MILKRDRANDRAATTCTEFHGIDLDEEAARRGRTCGRYFQARPIWKSLHPRATSRRENSFSDAKIRGDGTHNETSELICRYTLYATINRIYSWKRETRLAARAYIRRFPIPFPLPSINSRDEWRFSIGGCFYNRLAF